MTAEITTVIGQFSIVNGMWQNKPVNQVAVREPKSADVLGAGKGDLFVLTEVRGQEEDQAALEEQLAEIFRDTYYMARGSITASLRRAMQVTGSLLYDRNYAVGVEKRVIGGLVAVAVHGEDAFVAQIGPTACFTVLSDYVRRYPTKSVWLDEAIAPAEENAPPVLGTNLLVEPALNHLRVGPEDVIVLADSGLAGQLPLDDVGRAVNGSDIKAALKNLGSVAQAQGCSALVLAVIERDKLVESVKMNPAAPLNRLLQREQPQPVSAIAAGGRPWLSALAGKVKKPTFINHEKLPRSSPKELPLAEAGPQPWGEAVAEDPAFADEPVTAGRGQKVKEMASVAAGVPFQAQLRPSRHAGDSAGLGQFFSWGRRLTGGLGTALLMLVALFGKGIKLLLSPFTGGDEPRYRQAGMQANRTQTTIPWGMLRLIAVAIPLVVGVIVGVSYLQKGRMVEAEYTRLMTEAQNKFTQAQAVTDRAAATTLMAEAKTLLAQAEQIKPDQAEITTLRQNISQQTDKLVNIQRLYLLSPLRQYTDPGTDLKNVIVQGVEAYVLDAGNDRVYHHRLDDAGQALLPDNENFLTLARDQTIDNITVGEVQGMTWMPVGGSRQTSDLMILSNSGLLEYHPNWGVAASTLANQDTLISPVSVASYFGNFYVLDPSANQLLRYLPTADGYSALPESYFPLDQPVDLAEAVDFSIDGAVYLLFRDGRITKYLSGQPADFNINGLDQPFKNPTAIFTAPNEEVQYIYVADAGNQRIVQLNKDGSFARQFKPREGEAVSFANLQDIYVDEIGGRLYVLDSNNLYVGSLPTP